MLEQAIEDIADAERFEDTVIITVLERLDVFNATPLMAEFDRWLDEGVRHFIVDLSAVRVVDGDGDYPLLHLLKSVQSVDGSVVLVCPPGNPIGIFYEMMRLDTLFDIVGSLDEARNRL
jgi:anti-anti-sigma factor